ncbi:formamidopyrimidine-DNA glycosylase [Robbsia andropogonis]|uniref:Formamidopyrimidine-DNA glycosylase n=1 Tax=Robbsia andropogonis TaxID=28092 RepID=A0A0F5K5W8_9BURK|nr:bifunctional DNA-formamidopyrimidine glycosylase/DNA-(apurinic or apyrimidinic site) lyase [Robbsia andropogonis]KKB65254.1 formamidopyrimidine-DNA glycosylase [Robbsia andropogonis]MCP1117162.1 bifunctional DNA-formamidopyrimidine glycosylase/DNA-(apurinic or apyrimidinic site) lyase [Robbsia andropogonis]MCP1128508.1 bifunctional DNA-formamidopyrimidine glycosylase/DNA-(apurinic or apyrimidinic site) lyase [Robbsia andropogonis]
MPELPEIEVTRRGIAPYVESRRVRAVHARAPALRWPIPTELPDAMRGRVITSVTRRGKYLLLESDAGWLILHLGMSGSLRVLQGEDRHLAPGRHDHLDVVFDDAVLRLRDPRRFGAALWHPRAAGDVLAHPLLVSLGVEPFSDAFSGALLFARTRGRSMAVKQALLAGTIVVGVGNIYASESLFRAGIRPTTAAGRISRQRYDLLAERIREVLGEAIEQGGSTLRDFIGSDGASGYFQMAHAVYDRDGQPCRVCLLPIRKIVQGQRSTFFCPRCQH